MHNRIPEALTSNSRTQTRTQGWTDIKSTLAKKKNNNNRLPVLRDELVAVCAVDWHCNRCATISLLYYDG